MSGSVTEVDEVKTWLEGLKARPGDEHFASYARNHRARFAGSLAALPRGAGSSSLLELACFGYFMPFFYDKAGYTRLAGSHHRTQGHVHIQPQDAGSFSFDLAVIDVETDAYPFKDEEFDTVLCWELIEHMAYDPMHMLAEVNRVTKTGGRLFITTPNIASARSLRSALWGGQPQLYSAYPKQRILDRHHIEYAPVEIVKLMAAAGFEVERLWTEDFYSSGHDQVLEILKTNGFPTDLRGDTILAIGRKVCGVNERYPTPIYE